jgi:hypothetical protein
MKWIFLAILVVIVPYTFIRLHYQKPNRAFEPYADMKNQANTLRLLSAGFQRITLEADRPVEAPRLTTPAAPTSAALPGLPSALAETLIDQPILPREILSVTAAATTNSLFAYPVLVTCTLPDQKHQLAGGFLYLRDDELIFVPQFENIDGDLSARTREHTLRLTVPAGSLKPGTYRATLPGAHTSKSWPLEVR